LISYAQGSKTGGKKASKALAAAAAAVAKGEQPYQCCAHTASFKNGTVNNDRK
jgi:hypothetical protein